MSSHSSSLLQGNAQCYSNPTCAGPAILGLSPMDCCLGEGLSYGEPGDCQICYRKQAKYMYMYQAMQIGTCSGLNTVERLNN